VLYTFQPPTTEEEIRAAALQFVRKVSGLQKPPAADEAAFAQAIDEVAATTSKLLHTLTARTAVRTREGEKERAKLRWQQREARIKG
jgi:hypothetical protein